MKSNLKRWYSVIAVVSIVLGLMASSVSPVWADPAIIPPQAKGHCMTYGMTYGEWSAKWWQWALSLPVAQNPFFDVDGSCANGANGQLGPVWFLTGVINTSGTAVRDCTVPAEKTLFFPIINTECSTLEVGTEWECDGTEEDCTACAASKNIGNVFATIDGVPVRNLKRYLVESPLFTFTVPSYPDNVLGVVTPPATGQSVSNGYYLMLAPLSVGKHTIHFGAAYLADDGTVSFALDITYYLTVVPGKK